MTMVLVNGITADVEPVPGRNGWFQLNGKGIQAIEVYSDASEYLSDTSDTQIEDAKLLGIHGTPLEVEDLDPRLTREGDADDEYHFAILRRDDGSHYLVMSVNRLEYAVMSFLMPTDGAEGQEDFRA